MRLSRKTLLTALGLAAAIGTLVWAFAPRPTPVDVAVAAKGRFEAVIAEDGKTRVRDRYTVSAPLAGRLARIAQKEGDTVTAGAVVAHLDPLLPPMTDARTASELGIRVQSAEAALAGAAADADQARVALQRARTVVARSEQLAAGRYISALQLDSDRLAVSAAERGLSSAQERRHVAQHGVDEARAALRNLQDDGGADAGFAVRTPVAGRVLRVLQPSAGTVALGTPLLEIGDVRDLEIEAELLTADAVHVGPDTAVRIGRWGGEGLLQGRVRRVEPAAFTKVSALGVEEQRVVVRIDITSPPTQWNGLGDGYRVGVELVTDVHEGVLLVPVSAVFPPAGAAPGKAMNVFAVREGRARLTPVTVAARNSQWAWIQSGLAAGDRVIQYPAASLRDGLRVRARREPQ